MRDLLEREGLLRRGLIMWSCLILLNLRGGMFGDEERGHRSLQVDLSVLVVMENE